MAQLIQLPLNSGGSVLVEGDADETPGELSLATGGAGRPVARAAATLEDALEEVIPVLHGLAERLRQAKPRTLDVEFGLKVGGQTGIIIAKGTAEVNFVVKMSWTSESSDMHPLSG